MAILAGASPHDWALVAAGGGVGAVATVVTGCSGGHSVGQSVDAVASIGMKKPLYQTTGGKKKSNGKTNKQNDVENI